MKKELFDKLLNDYTVINYGENGGKYFVSKNNISGRRLFLYAQRLSFQLWNWTCNKKMDK